MDNLPKYFFRVHIKLDDPDSDAHLAFDFDDKIRAIAFADTAYNACDLHKVWVEIVTTEEDTTESPMWRV